MNCPVHVIGLGTTGSHICCHTGKWGRVYPAGYHVWDGDKVEEHNLRNQMYRPGHISMLKTSAMAEQLREWGGITAIEHAEYISGSQSLSGVVFMCVDKMTSGRTIWDTCIRYNSAVELLIETRVDASHALIHVVDPNNAAHVKSWEKYWYPDEDAVNEGGCGGPDPVGSETADVAAVLAVWQLRRYAAIKEGFDDRLDNQIRLSMRPLKLETYQW